MKLKKIVCLSMVILSCEGKVMIKVTSPAFKDAAQMPARYTCDGEDISRSYYLTEFLHRRKVSF